MDLLTTRRNLLTTRRMRSDQTCPYQGYLRHELRLRSANKRDSLRFDEAIRLGVAAWRKYHSSDAVFDSFDSSKFESSYEAARAMAVLTGYCQTYDGHVMEFANFGGEQSIDWTMPLKNPDTSGTSRTYQLAGTIEAITPDGWIYKTRTTSNSVSASSRFWQYMRLDHDATLNYLAARHMGLSVQGVMYDGIHKPQHSPKMVPILDENDLKIVLDEGDQRVFNKNGTPRQVAGEGFHLHARPETAAEFGDRILNEITDSEEPQFNRRAFFRLDDELAAFEHELWQSALVLAFRRRTGCWSKQAGESTCGRCEYADLCLQGLRVEPGVVPSGYVYDTNEMEDSE